MAGSYRVRRFEEELWLVPRGGGDAVPAGGARLEPMIAALTIADYFPDGERARATLVDVVRGVDRHLRLSAANAPVHWLVARVADALRERRIEAFLVPVASGRGSAGAAKEKPASAPPPPPPPPPDDDEKMTWFEVGVTDAWGEPVGDAQIEIAWQGNQKKGKTSGDGTVRFDDVPGSPGVPGAARILNGKAVRKAVLPRFGDKPQPEGMPDVPGPRRLLLRDEMNDTAIRSEAETTLVLVRPLPRIRLHGMHFDTNKCFLRETAMRGMRAVVDVYRSIPTGALLIAGHTDTSGGDDDNLTLSVERAASVKAFLTDDVAAWEAWFGSDKPGWKRWGQKEIMSMISALPCGQSVTGFQQWSNDVRGTSLKVDGDAGPKTRRALIEAYMALDGTTLPDGIGAEIHGCGEFFPLADASDNFGQDGVGSAEDRRVEIFCFDDEIHPPVPGEKATKGEPEYEQWKNQVTEDIDVESAAGTEDVGKIWMEIWDKTGLVARAGMAYEITGDGSFSGTTDASGRLLHEEVPNGDYRLKISGLDEDSAALVLPTADDEPQIRFMQ